MSKKHWQDVFAGFQSTVCKNKLTFMKKAVLYTTSLDCKVRYVLCDLFSTNQENGSEITFVAGAKNQKFENLDMFG